MLIHMKNIKQEFLHTQVYRIKNVVNIICIIFIINIFFNKKKKKIKSVCEARNRSIETEDHLKQIAERQSGRLKNEIKDIESKISTLSDEVYN